MPNDALTERQRRLLDAVLDPRRHRARVRRRRLREQRVLRLRRHPAAVLPRVAAVVRAAAADQLRGAGPTGAAGRGRDHRLPHDRGAPARDHRPGVGNARDVDQPVPGHGARVREPAAAPARRHRVATGSARAVGRPRRPGADDRRQPPGVGRPARRAAPVARRREHRRVRQRAAARDPVDLHRGGPRGHPRVPVPAGAAGARVPGTPPAGRGRPFVRRFPARPAASWA